MAGDPQLIIRAVRPSEYEIAGELTVEAYRTLSHAGDEAYERELRDIAGRRDDSEILVAEVGCRVVGCVTFVDGLKALSEVDDPDAATVRMLGVVPEARGRGVGEALMRECIDRARQSGRKRVRLDTRTSMTSAQRLYERLGFRRDPDHDWSPAPGILLLGYVLDLSPSSAAVR
jgi:ribosomal protein S18 acetylase RimI-like enzyme